MQHSLRHLNALRAFEAAARRSSFARAASELNVSHSVVSQHVKNLERWFGTQLFLRRGNSIELTEDGRALLPQIASAFQTLRDACDSMLRRSQFGTVTVSAEPAIASRWLRKRITEFCAQFPKIEVDLKPAWRPPQTGEHRPDIIVHFETRLPTGNPGQTKLLPIDAFPACAPALHRRIPIDGGVAQFTGVPIIHDNGREIWHQWFSKFLPDCDDWEKGKVYSDLSLAIDAAVDGEGVILADPIICKKELDSGALRKLDDRLIRCVWYCATIADNTPAHAPATLFYNWLLDKGLEHRLATATA